MRKGKTQRGFAIYRFKEENGNACSLQKSSSVTPRVWLGCSELGVKVGHPWTAFTEEEVAKALGGREIVGNNRMHLNRRQVKALIPLLQHFVDTGELP